MAQALVSPASIEMIVGEKLNITIDFTNLIAPGDVCSAPVVSVKTQYNESVPSCIIGTPSFTNNILAITISSAPLRSKTNYVLVASATVTGGGSTKTMAAQLNLKIVY